MNKLTHSLTVRTMLAVTILGASHLSQADDTEIYFSENLTNVRQNVMFVIDGSGSMNNSVGSETRLDVMKKALTSVLQAAPDNLNVGLMNFGELGEHLGGHGVKFPVSPIDDEALPIVTSKFDSSEWWRSSIPEPSSTITVRDYLSDITDWYWKDNWYDNKYKGKSVKEMTRTGATPLVDALYEAGLYFRGDKVTFGLGPASYDNRWSAHPSTYDQGIIQTSCTSSQTQTVNGKIDFDDGEYEWLQCANSDNTSVSYANCKTSESCTTTSVKTGTKKVCETVDTSNWVAWAGYYWYWNGYNWENKGRISDYSKNKNKNCTWEDVYEEQTQCSYDVCTATGPSIKPNYVSPITQECQSNYIVLLSDGEPTSYLDDYYDYNETYKGLKAGTHPTMTDKSDASDTFTHNDCETSSSKFPSGFHDGVCGPEIARFLANTDNSDLPGTQSVRTYTVGLGLSGDPSAENYLKSLVTTDDDPSTPEVEGYFSVENEEQIAAAFSNILTEISSTTTSFASPGYTVNARTGLENEDVIYIPVFDKQLAPRWNGNLKKFSLKKDVDGSNSTIVGKTGKVAVSELGVFYDNAIDLYSSSTTGDGNNVSKGGLANLINPNTRKALTNIACTKLPCILDTVSNRLLPENTTLLNLDLTSVFGILDLSFLTDLTGLLSGKSQSEAKIEKTKGLVNFIRGRTWNETTKSYDLAPRMGDMLHSEPVIVTYDKDYKASASEDKSYNKQVIFAGTNEGYLHAFDTVSGQELFAFMPESLIKNINVQYENTGSGNHAYGIDGIITTWTSDKNKDGVISAQDGDHVYLYFGLRRGGREYYAMDVTDPTDPKLLWELNSSTNKFENLGQSWSTPYVTQIRVSDTELREVVIFTGGYDENQDIQDIDQRATSDSMGNDVFIVDAHTGAYIWSVQGGTTGSAPLSGASELTHSIPGGARLLDMNRDGAIDRMYFADTGGKVWRLELPMGPDYGLSGAKLIEFADLASGTGEDARMFYNEPDVALLKHKGQNWLTVSLGSGYRSHPADGTVSDKFFVLLDAAVNTPLTKNLAGDEDFTAIEVKDMVEVSTSGSAVNQGAMTDQTIFDVENKSGWYLVLPEDGEKVLSTSVTLEGKVMFTTLVPGLGVDMTDIDVCTAPATQGRLYSLNILTAEAGSDLNDDEDITDADLFTLVSSNEIPGTPQLVFNSPYCADGECKHLVDIRVGKKNSAVTNYNSDFLESVFWTNPTK